MTTRTDTFDLGALRLSSGEGRHLELGIAIEPFELGAGSYTVMPAAADAAAEAEAGAVGLVAARLEISRMTGDGYALHLRFSAALHGPCMRCLEPAAPEFGVDAREVSQPGEGEELESPYVIESILDLGAWARDALALALPPAMLCKPDCLGLCPVCGANLNNAGPEHRHEAAPDPRWAALSELKFEGDADARASAEGSPQPGGEAAEPGQDSVT